MLLKFANLSLMFRSILMNKTIKQESSSDGFNFHEIRSKFEFNNKNLAKFSNLVKFTLKNITFIIILIFLEFEFG